MKKKREEQEEERRKVLDIEEEKIAAERRREQIEKAKQLQYYKSDRVRTFHVRYYLSKSIERLFLIVLECTSTHGSPQRTRYAIGNEETYCRYATE